MNTKFHNLAIFTTARGHITVTVRNQEFQDGSYRCYVVRDFEDGVFGIMRDFGTDTDAAIAFAENYIRTIDATFFLHDPMTVDLDALTTREMKSCIETLRNMVRETNPVSE